MNDLTNILTEAERFRAEGEDFAVATVVRVDGPAYRRPGARLLVSGNGAITGALSGGCIEGELVERACHVMSTGRPELIAFDVRDDDPVLGFGTGCGGTVHVLLEHATGHPNAGGIRMMRETMQSPTRATLATVYRGEGASPGSRLVLREDGTLEHEGIPDGLRTSLLEVAHEVIASGRSRVGVFEWEDGEAEVLLEAVRPPTRLFLFGDGADIAPVAALAARTGWRVVVVGNRPKPGPHWSRDTSRYVFLMHPEQVLDHVQPGEWDAAVVMTHNYVRDRTLLRGLFNSSSRYVGLIGPRSRTQQILGELRAEGVDVERELPRLHAPVGLDIGSETPDEIAVSIVAEVLAVLNDRLGAPLREKGGAIHRAVPLFSKRG
jgi:xanthine dehydrogenase accessory factor